MSSGAAGGSERGLQWKCVHNPERSIRTASGCLQRLVRAIRCFRLGRERLAMRLPRYANFGEACRYASPCVPVRMNSGMSPCKHWNFSARNIVSSSSEYESFAASVIQMPCACYHGGSWRKCRINSSAECVVNVSSGSFGLLKHKSDKTVTQTGYSHVDSLERTLQRCRFRKPGRL